MTGFQGYDQWKTASPYDCEDSPENIDWQCVFPDHDSPWELYREVYKYTPCGPNVGFRVRYIECGDNGEGGPHNPGDIEHEKWLYCEDLKQIPKWSNLEDILLTGISVSSIVEGVDETTETIVIDIDVYDGEYENKIAEQFWNAVNEIDRQADDIWCDTHGCPDCFPEDEQGPINEFCESCGGYGEII